MTQCPGCESYAVELDAHFKVPRCYGCGWMPASQSSIRATHLYKLCDRCWGHSELSERCKQCNNTGLVLNELGQQIKAFVMDILKEK